MKKIQVEINDFSNFKGGWGLAPFEIYLTIKHVEFNDVLNILEFGSGDGTTNLVNLLKLKNVIFDYTSIEHDEAYAKTPDVKYHLYNLNNNYVSEDITKVTLELDKTYDLVIVDGPHGVGRANWYSKFKKNVRNGTIILVDDFHHYKEFGEELDKHFIYETVNLFNQNRQFTETDINEGIETIDINNSFIMDKSYKIIKVKGIK